MCSVLIHSVLGHGLVPVLVLVLVLMLVIEREAYAYAQSVRHTGYVYSYYSLLTTYCSMVPILNTDHISL